MQEKPLKERKKKKSGMGLLDRLRVAAHYTSSWFAFANK